MMITSGSDMHGKRCITKRCDYSSSFHHNVRITVKGMAGRMLYNEFNEFGYSIFNKLVTHFDDDVYG